MGYYCSLCGTCTGDATVKKFIGHLNYRHGISAFQKIIVQCGQNDCKITLSSVASFRTHLHSKHPHDPHPGILGCTSTSQMDDTCDRANTASTSGEDCETGNNMPPVETTDGQLDIFQLIADFILRLRSRIINQSIVDFVASGLEWLLSALFDMIKVKLDPLSSKYSVVSDLLCSLEETFTAFDTIRSDYNQKKYLKEKKGLIEPEEILLGTRCEQYLDRSRVSSLKYVPETIQYISIKKTINTVLNKLGHKIGKKHRSENVVMKDYMDASQFSQHPLFLEDNSALQLHMYFDEFETVNPLGSKTKIHKIGGLYMSIKNLPVELNSKLVNIHPVIFCHSQDVYKYGFKTVFDQMLTDLKDLEKGVTMEVNGKEQVVRAALVLWSGDNLGIHQVFGFCESFQANKPCHFCYIHKQDIQNCFTLDSVNRRTHEQYLLDVEHAKTNFESTKDTGVKSDFPLESLTYFRFPDNVGPDAMHDILEGSLQYTIKVVLVQCIQVKGHFKLKLLNSRIRSFNYGSDRVSKPSDISKEKLFSSDKKLGLNASQSWCFGRYLPLLIGDLVPADEPCIEVLQYMLDIADIIFSPKITVGLTLCLEKLVTRYLELFKMNFPEYSVIPKQHFLLHYPQKIRELGPSIGYWCMRMEAKHAKAKEYAHILHCFKNICKSVAWDHQIKAAISWSDILSSEMDEEIGTGYCELPARLDVPAEIFLQASIPVYVEVYVCNFVKIKGIKYTVSQVLPVSFSLGHPQFGLIQYILYVPGKTSVTFILKRLFTSHYDSHLHSYAVLPSDDFLCCTHSDFIDHHPLHLADSYSVNSNFSYIVTKYELIDEEECDQLKNIN